MKLSEKLAVLEEEDRKAAAAKATAEPGQARPRASGTGAKSKPHGSSPWEDSKRKVRGMVLSEVAPKMGKLKGEQLAAEVKNALDKILQRQDVQVSPLERRKFVQEVIQDTLGYG